jgi:hypothetical protein
MLNLAAVMQSRVGMRAMMDVPRHWRIILHLLPMPWAYPAAWHKLCHATGYVYGIGMREWPWCWPMQTGQHGDHAAHRMVAPSGAHDSPATGTGKPRRKEHIATLYQSK